MAHGVRIHMMLSTALAMMMDATECVLFLKTPNAITSSDAVSKTESPWLFYELAMMRLIRRKKPRRMTIIDETFAIKSAEKLPIEYLAELSDLTPLNGDFLALWHEVCREARKAKQGALDILYTIAPEDPATISE